MTQSYIDSLKVSTIDYVKSKIDVHFNNAIDKVVAPGSRGVNGPTGARGETGATGPRGMNGVAGVNGPTGATGPIGASGPEGLIGLTGATGANGVTGDRGVTGETGATGPSGISGVQGVTGAIGPTGPGNEIPGGQGSTGATGSLITSRLYELQDSAFTATPEHGMCLRYSSSLGKWQARTAKVGVLRQNSTLNNSIQTAIDMLKDSSYTTPSTIQGNLTFDTNNGDSGFLLDPTQYYEASFYLSLSLTTAISGFNTLTIKIVDTTVEGYPAVGPTLNVAYNKKTGNVSGFLTWIGTGVSKISVVCSADTTITAANENHNINMVFVVKEL